MTANVSYIRHKKPSQASIANINGTAPKIFITRIHKHASCHTFRHSFATRLLQAKYDLKQIQTLMGHTDIRTTEIYLHVLDELGDRVKSPLDA